MPLPEDLQIRNMGLSEELPIGQPSGTIKRSDFVDDHNLHNAEFGKWLEDGIKGDMLQATYYIHPRNKKKSACFTPDQEKHNIAILKRHGELK